MWCLIWATNCIIVNHFCQFWFITNINEIQPLLPSQLIFTLQFLSRASPQHSFHLICIIRKAHFCQPTPTSKTFFSCVSNPRRVKNHSSCASANVRLFSKVLQHNASKSVVSCSNIQYVSCRSKHRLYSHTGAQCSTKHLNERSHGFTETDRQRQNRFALKFKTLYLDHLHLVI